MTDLTSGLPPATPSPRKPRKIFLLVGIVVAAALGIGLFTSAGTKKNTGPPQPGQPVPSFSAPRLNGSGAIQVPQDGGSGGTPAVLLFFGNWCASCHGELPPLAAAVRQQEREGGALAKVRVIGVDSDHEASVGEKFVKSSGVAFPVAHDPLIAITNNKFLFEGSPDAVFIKGDGTISAVLPGPLSVAKFTAEEQKLIPSES